MYFNMRIHMKVEGLSARLGAASVPYPREWGGQGRPVGQKAHHQQWFRIVNINDTPPPPLPQQKKNL